MKSLKREAITKLDLKSLSMFKGNSFIAKCVLSTELAGFHIKFKKNPNLKKSQHTRKSGDEEL